MRHRPFCKTVVLLMLFWVMTQSNAQMEMPREYVPEGEIVSIKSDVNFSMAIELLSEYAVDYAGKPIYDPTRQSGSIGLDIEQMPWRDALEAILSRRGLWYKEQEHYFQIIESPEGQETEEDRLFQELQLRPGQREIKIETIFFQGDRNKLAEIGIDWTTLYNGQVAVTAEQLGAFQATEEMLNLTVRIPNSLFGVDVDALLKAFDSNEIGTVLAQPQVTVTEGHEGMVQVGQDFSIKTRDFAGNITDRFFSTGTILRVTPYVMEDEQGRLAIILNAHIEKSQASPSTVSTVIDKSEANSLVQLYDGEETIIAGLYSNENRVIRSGVPLLKDLPWWFLGLRYLFGYNRTSVDQQELIIVMRASLLPNVYDRAASGFVTRNQHRNPVRTLSRYRYQDYSNELRALWNTKVEPKTSDERDENYFDYDASSKTTQPEKEKSSVTAAKGEAGGEKRYYRIVPPKGDEISYRESMGDQQFYFGKVLYEENGVVLIQWNKHVDPSRLRGKQVTIFRKQSADRIVPVTKMMIVNSKGNRTAAASRAQPRSPVRAGDLAGILLNR